MLSPSDTVLRLLRPVVGNGTSDNDCENGRRCGGGGRVALAGGTRREFAIQPDMKSIARRSWLSAASLDMDASSCRSIAIVVVYRLW